VFCMTSDCYDLNQARTLLDPNIICATKPMSEPRARSGRPEARAGSVQCVGGYELFKGMFNIHYHSNVVNHLQNCKVSQPVRSQS
jgi:hypothetical protein